MSWFAESLYPAVGQRFEVRRELHRGRSAFQEIVVLETVAFGRMLVLDGVVQTSERDEFVYHEMLAHLPLFAHGGAREVLIIGGGDGGLLEEVLKHPVARVTMVEIDGAVIEASRRHLPSICGKAFEDPRTRLVIGDGARFLSETEERFDLILIDSSDPVGPAAALFAHPFYAACRAALAEGGILAVQNGVPFLQGAELAASHRQRMALFAHAGCYLAPVPTYWGGFMAFGWASARDLEAGERAAIDARVKALSLDLAYYTAAIHHAAFALPAYVRKLLD